jgi:alkyl hydroperoxide reductase subunit F
MKIQIYSKEWCPYCTKAKLLLQNNGLKYEEFDITADSKIEQEMVKRSGRRSVPQIFIDNVSIGGYDDLIRLSTSNQLLKNELTESEVETDTIYEVIIIGGGPAGMSAAIYSSRKNLSTLLVSTDIGGQVGTTQEISNYPGIGSISGPDLVQNLEQHMRTYEVETLIGERVIEILLEEGGKVVLTASGKRLRAHAVIIATGAVKRTLNIPGEIELAGRGVVYCSTCDGPLFKDMTIAIIGSGNSGLEAAIEMDGIASKVYLISRGELNGDQILQDKLSTAKNIEVITFHEPTEIYGSGKTEGLMIKSISDETTRALSVGGVFVEIGLFANSDFAINLLEINKRGEITISSNGHTGVTGVFAAGDVTNIYDKQIIIAAGSGASAALAAFEYLVTRQ